MRGVLRNIRQGITDPLEIGAAVPAMHMQQARFWIWHVAAVRLQFFTSVAGNPSLDFNVDQILYIPLGLTSSGQRTEFDQLASRRGFSYVNQPGDPDSMEFSFATTLRHTTGAPVEESWFVGLGFTAYQAPLTLSRSNLGTGVSGVTLTISGTDPLYGTEYFYTETLFGPPSISGNVSITPAAYYPYKNELGQPLFDTVTGMELPDPALLQ